MTIIIPLFVKFWHGGFIFTGLYKVEMSKGRKFKKSGHVMFFPVIKCLKEDEKTKGRNDKKTK